jgi:hypothetical protein
MRLTAFALIVSLLSVPATTFAQEANDWRKVAEAIPIGSKVKVQTYEGKRVSGVLMRADSTAVLVKRNTRHPEPAVAVAYQDVARIEREKDGGMNVGKAVAIGLAAGGAAIVTLMLFALQFD